jgi:MFS family permease
MRFFKVSGALSHRNFFIFYAGYAVSLTGSWIQTVTTAWLVYRITGSGFWLGTVTFAGQIPAFVFAPIGGVLADRCSRKLLVMTTQIMLMLQAFLTGILFMTGTLYLNVIIILEIFLGLVKAIDVPVRQAFIIDMVEDNKDLSNAIALNSILFNGARLIGPLAAALIISKAGEGWSYFINGISFTAVVISLLVMRLKEDFSKPENSCLTVDLLDGFDYAFNNVPVFTLIAAGAFFNFLPVMVLYPVFAHDILSGNSGTYGLMVSASGMGAVAGALFMVKRSSCLGLGSAIFAAAFSLGAGTMVLSFSSSVSAACMLCFSVGGSTMILNSGSNAILQRISDPAKRGRVLSLWIMAAMGASPLGSFAGGLAANTFGVKPVYLIAGLIGLAGVIILYLYIPGVNKALADNIIPESAI